jgi:glutathione S-transferase
MKLYYSPGTCSLASHIALFEAGLTFESVAAPTKTHKLADGTDFYTINPLGYVPVLELDDGRRLREGPAILQYIADQAPQKNLAPANGTFERYQLQEWLNFIATEVHKSFSPLFAPGTPAETRTAAQERLRNRLTWVNTQLEGKKFLMGDTFTVADAYLFNVTNWAKLVNVDLSTYAHLLAFRTLVSEHPSVDSAMKAEGLKR